MVRHPRPADEARLSYIQSVVRVPTPRPTKKARGRVTPGLQSHRPKGSGVTVEGGTWGASRRAGHRRPRGSSTRTTGSYDCLPSCPLLRPPGVQILLPHAWRSSREHLLDIRLRLKVHQSDQILSGSSSPVPLLWSRGHPSCVRGTNSAPEAQLRGRPEASPSGSSMSERHTDLDLRVLGAAHSGRSDVTVAREASSRWCDGEANTDESDRAVLNQPGQGRARL